MSCRTYSAGGWVNTSPRSESRGELGEIMMTSSEWCHRSIKTNVLWVLFIVVLKWASNKRHAGYDLWNLFVNTLDPFMVHLLFVHPSGMARCAGMKCTEYQVENGGSLIIIPDWQDQMRLVVSHKGMLYKKISGLLNFIYMFVVWHFALKCL